MYGCTINYRILLLFNSACVKYADNCKRVGVDWRSDANKNTIYHAKHLLGKKNNADMRDLLSTFQFVSKSLPDQRISIPIEYLGKRCFFTPEQILANILQHAKKIASSKRVNSLVITVPSSYTNSERLALLRTAKMAEVNVERLLNDTTAAAIFYRSQSDITKNTANRFVVIVDVGVYYIQVSLFSIGYRQVKAINHEYAEIGGRDIDLLLAERIREIIKAKRNILINTKSNDFHRLIVDCERLKKVFANNPGQTGEFEVSFSLDDEDICESLPYAELKSIFKKHFEPCSDLFERALRNSSKCVYYMYYCFVECGLNFYN